MSTSYKDLESKAKNIAHEHGYQLRVAMHEYQYQKAALKHAIKRMQDGDFSSDNIIKLKPQN